jgi:hypothetical protein
MPAGEGCENYEADESEDNGDDTEGRISNR